MQCSFDLSPHRSNSFNARPDNLHRAVSTHLHLFDECVATMSGKYAFTKTLKELRFLHCQTSEHSNAVRYAHDTANPL